MKIYIIYKYTFPTSYLLSVTSLSFTIFYNVFFCVTYVKPGLEANI
jgi:hypothetical protein